MKLEYDELLSSCVFRFNLRRFSLVFDKYADPATMKDRIGVPEAVLAKMQGRPELKIIR